MSKRGWPFRPASWKIILYPEVSALYIHWATFAYVVVRPQCVWVCVYPSRPTGLIKFTAFWPGVGGPPRPSPFRLSQAHLPAQGKHQKKGRKTCPLRRVILERDV